MADAALHELAPHHLPVFIPSADGGDPLMTIMLVVLIIGVVLLGTFYLHLHSLPERLAHKHGRIQFELVAILGLLALFTHNQIFWVAALLLAFVQIPDFWSPLESMAHSLSRLAGTGGVSSEELVERDLMEEIATERHENALDRGPNASAGEDEPAPATKAAGEGKADV